MCGQYDDKAKQILDQRIIATRATDVEAISNVANLTSEEYKKYIERLLGVGFKGTVTANGLFYYLLNGNNIKRICVLGNLNHLNPEIIFNNVLGLGLFAALKAGVTHSTSSSVLLSARQAWKNNFCVNQNDMVQRPYAYTTDKDGQIDKIFAHNAREVTNVYF